LFDARRRKVLMYIGIGAIVLILLVVLIVMLMRGRTV
jgi:hypothetical protein